MRFVSHDKTRKGGNKTSSVGKLALFQKILFSAASQVIREKIGRSCFLSTRKIVLFKKNSLELLYLKKSSFQFHKKFQKNLCPLFNCNLMTVMLDKTRKHSWIFFFHWKLSLFLKRLAFQQPLRCYRNDPKTCTRFKWTLSEA